MKLVMPPPPGMPVCMPLCIPGCCCMPCGIMPGCCMLDCCMPGCIRPDCCCMPSLLLAPWCIREPAGPCCIAGTPPPDSTLRCAVRLTPACTPFMLPAHAACRAEAGDSAGEPAAIDEVL